jgi:hypothetical protein
LEEAACVFSFLVFRYQKVADSEFRSKSAIAVTDHLGQISICHNIKFYNNYKDINGRWEPKSKQYLPCLTNIKIIQNQITN